MSAAGPSAPEDMRTSALLAGKDGAGGGVIGEGMEEKCEGAAASGRAAVVTTVGAWTSPDV